MKLLTFSFCDPTSDTTSIPIRCDRMQRDPAIATLRPWAIAGGGLTAWIDFAVALRARHATRMTRTTCERRMIARPMVKLRMTCPSGIFAKWQVYRGAA
jgi:hypothetical protein